MALRPATARWFQLMITRGELANALLCLAATGEVELQAHGKITPATLLPTLQAAVTEFRNMAEHYAQYWNKPSAVQARGEREAEDISAFALQQLRSWAVAANPIIERLQKLALERQDLDLLERLLVGTGNELPHTSTFIHAGPALSSRAYVLAQHANAPQAPASLLLQMVSRGDQKFLLVLGPAAEVAAFDDILCANKARRITLPRELPAAREAAHAATCSQIEKITRESQSLDSRLQELNLQHAVGAALTDLNLIEWLVQNVSQLALSEHFAWITGWNSAASGSRLEAALSKTQLPYLLRFPPAPPDVERPVILRNPLWVQPFEFFLRLLGTPGLSETDPSRLLALVAPLMFGYMFADVGQGAVLLIAGLVLRKKWPATALLITGGCAAIAFGFLFGSVFGSEQIVSALWLRPLNRPLFVLGVSLAFGACVILLGLCLDGVQYWWSGRGSQWWATRAGLVLGYLGLSGAALDVRFLWALPAGITWYITGSILLAPEKRLTALGMAAGESVQTTLQVAINTVSFVRVGAFALAHAGLCSAFAAVAAAIGWRPIAWLVLAFGNVLIIFIEGLVVGIQTTRLVLFEFFVRFLQSQGRAFRPLLMRAAAPDIYPSLRTSP